MTRSTIASSTAASIFTLGRKSTTYSAPRYSSVWPFWRPKPLTSVTVTPCTPMALRASRTSSSLNGLMIAVSIFIAVLLGARGSERLRQRHHGARAAGARGEARLGGLEHVLLRGADDGGADHPA